MNVTQRRVFDTWPLHDRYMQVAMLVFFVSDGAAQAWTGLSLVIPSLGVGLLGGTNYVQARIRPRRDRPSPFKFP